MIYICSDLHGCQYEKFINLLQSIDFSKADTLYILGDVIDRGSDGIKLLKWMMCQPNVNLILGNHEAMMLSCEFLFEEITEDSIDRLTGEKLQMYSVWLANSGQATINALSATRNSEIKYILEYLREAPLYDTLTVNGKDFLLTHSGLGGFDKSKKMSDYSPNDLLWNRPKLKDRYFEDVYTIFGHTPTVYFSDEHKGKILKTETWADVDVGVGLGQNPALLRLDDMKEIYFE